MTNDFTKILRNCHPIFKKLRKEETMYQILSNSDIHQVFKNEVFISKGSSKLSFFIVLSGWLRIYNYCQGTPILTDFSCGTILGQDWLFDQSRIIRQYKGVGCSQNSLLLEISLEQYKIIRGKLLESESEDHRKLFKDALFFESQIKMNYTNFL